MYFARPRKHLRLCRGDTLKQVFTLYENEPMNAQKYTPNDNDSIYFGVMEPNSCFEEALIRKKYTYQDFNDNLELKVILEPKDTLTVLPGMYYYQIKLKHGEEVYTLVPQTPFYIDN